MAINSRISVFPVILPCGALAQLAIDHQHVAGSVVLQELDGAAHHVGSKVRLLAASLPILSL